MKWAPLLLSICTVAGAAEPITEFDAAEEDAIRAAVLREMFKHPDGIRHPIFLECDGEKDASDALIARLADSKLRFRKASKAKARAPGAAGWVYSDRDTGEPGVMVTLGCIRRTVRGRAELKGGYYRNMMSGYGDTYLLERKNANWAVVKKKGHYEI